ncbi:phage tail sheath family protein [Foetidibacter luteolus]|uniref:phage tail sheath family protein n=1 Tax=Foetidibacter luteolus TaxID=2608880 RepID=UPI00129A2E59|nr:phage tail sheath C-terminal domain-containing protein [Foetidibacter luteolus]
MSQINESAIKTPGVYVNEIPTFPPSVAQVSTAVPAFIGYTQQALDSEGESLTNRPTKIQSLFDYERYFGNAENETSITVDINRTTNGSGTILSSTALAAIATPSEHNMYYSLRLYFENGGGPCYIVSVGATGGTIEVGDDTTGLQSGLAALRAYDEPTIILFPEGRALAEADYYGLVGLAIDQCASLQDRFTLIDVHYDPTNTTDQVMDDFRNVAPHTTGFGKSDNLSYGAAYYPDLRTLFDFRYQDTGVNVTITTDGVAAAAVALNTLFSTDSAAYYASKDAVGKLSPTLPPSPAIAGIYAKVDASRGVWKAPANISINSIYDVTDFITDAEQDGMNIDATSGKSVNAIRAFSGKGILVWGARTLDGNSNEWRYISVRRFFIMVEESVKKATAAFVFEPNDANTWTKVRSMIENYLTLLWRQGALAGAKAEHAFFVRVGIGQTMSAQDILEGRMIVEIGMAAVRPAEFIILRFSHKMQES